MDRWLIGKREELIRERIIKLQTSVVELNWVLDLIKEDRNDMSWLEEKIKKRINAFNIQIDHDLKVLEEEN